MKQKSERDLKEKPKITLDELEKTVVHTPTQEGYDILMRVYECGGLRWRSGNLPIQLNLWNLHKKETCIDMGNSFTCVYGEYYQGFTYANRKFYRGRGCKIISPQEFYDMQNVTPEMLREINIYFETITKE